MALEATSSLLMELVPKYFEPEAVVAVAGHREETTELLKLEFDFIFFTGSTSTGKVVARAAAENLTPVLLELGGQNPAVVDETANIKDAARKIAWGATAWGVVRGPRRQATLMCTNPLQSSWSRRQRPRSSNFMAKIQKPIRTIPA